MVNHRTTVSAIGTPDTRHRHDWRTLPPVYYVATMVYVKDSPYSASTRSIAVAIALRMGREGGKDVAFMSHRDITERTGLSISTVKRGTRRLSEGSSALFTRWLGGVTRGCPHSCYRYELLRTLTEQRGEEDLQPVS